MGAVDDGFYDGVLQEIGAPASPNTLSLCRTWQSYEGGSAAWNPWNTTQKSPTSTDYNSAGVQNFPDEQTGIEATVITLRNGYYPDVLAAFRADLPASQWGLNPAIIDQINTWGTHGFAAYLQSIAQQPTQPKEVAPMFGPVVVHITDADGGQLLVDSDGSEYGANGDYPAAVPMTADDYNRFTVNRAAKYTALLTALGGRG